MKWPKKAQDILALLGRYNFEIENESGVDEKEIEEIFIHNDWNTQDPSYDADIAVLLFKEQVVWSLYVKPICLPRASQTNVLKIGGTIIGWGQSVSERKTEKVPRKTQLSESQCTEQAKMYTSPRTFCATSETSSACKGDSGNFT